MAFPTIPWVFCEALVHMCHYLEQDNVYVFLVSLPGIVTDAIKCRNPFFLIPNKPIIQYELNAQIKDEKYFEKIQKLIKKKKRKKEKKNEERTSREHNIYISQIYVDSYGVPESPNFAQKNPMLPYLTI